MLAPSLEGLRQFDSRALPLARRVSDSSLLECAEGRKKTRNPRITLVDYFGVRMRLKELEQKKYRVVQLSREFLVAFLLAHKVELQVHASVQMLITNKICAVWFVHGCCLVCTLASREVEKVPQSVKSKEYLEREQHFPNL